jgi:hypothetical protein
MRQKRAHGTKDCKKVKEDGADEQKQKHTTAGIR